MRGIFVSLVVIISLTGCVSAPSPDMGANDSLQMTFNESGVGEACWSHDTRWEENGTWHYDSGTTCSESTSDNTGENQ